MTKQITVAVDEDGKVTVEAGGQKGPACLTDLAKLEQFLKENGLELRDKDSKKTSEYYATANSQTTGAR